MQHLDHATTRGHRLRRPHLRSTRRRLEPALVALTTMLLTGLIGVGSAIGASEIESVIPEIVPKAELPVTPDSEVNVAYAPNVPPPSGRTEPAIVEVALEVVEGVANIDPVNSVQYRTWGYRLPGDDQVISGSPGPIIRARVGDVLRFTITNPATNSMPHNVDFHAVTGQGGGAADTSVAPGQTATIEARLLYPGFFMYHCAFGDVPLHIAQGMYGGILVDPTDPLPPVDHELYIVQSEIYTTGIDTGLVDTDRQAITDEHPTYVVFNGAKGALTGENAPHMQVGERTRIYFIDAGPDLDSNFHPIGSHWDVVYPEATCSTRHCVVHRRRWCPPAGERSSSSSAVSQPIILVDHAISRAFDKGALGQIVVEGRSDPESSRPHRPRVTNAERPPRWGGIETRHDRSFG